MLLVERRRIRRHRRVHERVGAAAVELGVEPLPSRVSQVDAGDIGQQQDAIETEAIKRVLELAQRGVDVGQRQQRHSGESAWIAADDRGQRLVGRARQLVCATLISQVGARRTDGDRGSIDRVTRHMRVELLQGRRGDERTASVRCHEQLPIDVGHEVRVEVNATMMQSHCED
jgi:hypothetical protein